MLACKERWIDPFFGWTEMKKKKKENNDRTNERTHKISNWSLVFAYMCVSRSHLCSNTTAVHQTFRFCSLLAFSVVGFCFCFFGLSGRLRCGCCCWWFHCWTSFVYNFCLIAIGIIIIKTHTDTRTSRSRFKTPAKKRQKRNRKNKYGNHKRWAKHQYYFVHMPTWEVKVREKKAIFLAGRFCNIFVLSRNIDGIIQINFVRQQSATIETKKKKMSSQMWRAFFCGRNGDRKYAVPSQQN